jgi:hypothetical protein
VTRLPDNIVCNACVSIIGTVTEVEDKKRAGFFTNVCKPNPMPAKCPTCKGPLVRLNIKQEGA